MEKGEHTLPSALIGNIQRYSTKDGPGLRSTVFFVGCNLRCKWCANPEWMTPGTKILHHPQRCTGCGACVALAANGSITLTPEGCIIDRAACTNLADCANACFYDAYEVLGTEMTTKELAAHLLRDKEFYQISGGGVTFSGGEAALQGPFLREAAELLREAGVPTALDTAGHLPFEALLPTCQTVDLVLYDIKTMDEDIHRLYTGIDNGLLLENARKLAALGIPLVLRFILIPGINDGVDLERRLSFAKELGPAVRQVDLLPYHNLGAGKYRGLSMENPMDGIPACPDSVAEKVLSLATSMGLVATLGG